jgi:uncharacterized membrane protein
MNKAVKWMGARSGITLGFGFGGLFDGFFFHAILQWHHMLSNVVPPTNMHGMIVNMVADGVFDGFCWVVLVVGVVLAYKDGKAGVLPSGNAYFGWNLLGAGLFNFVEGIIDHDLLRIHHIRAVPSYRLWDLGFLLIPGLLFMVVGWILAKGARQS